MQRYWDLTNKERSELTSEQVEAMLVVQMMESGVTKVDAPVYLPVDIPVIPSRKMFGIKSGYSSVDEIVFTTAEEASAFLSYAIPSTVTYLGSQRLRVSEDTKEFSIEQIDVYSSRELTNNKAAVEKANANKKANDAAEAEYRLSLQKVNDACGGVWEDYRECQQIARTMEKIRATFEEYKGICDGDEVKAVTFLRKAFNASDVRDAFEWFGMELNDCVPAVAPEMATASADDF